MLALTQTSGYAVLALSCLDGPGRRWIGGRDIVNCTGAPGPYLSQILHALRRAGLIETKRGYQGGYRLRRPASAISVLEVVEAVDGPKCFGGCLLGLDECTDQRACPTHAFWKAEKARIRAYLGKLSLSKVAAFERPALDCCASGTPLACEGCNGLAGAAGRGLSARAGAASTASARRKPGLRTTQSIASTPGKPRDRRSAASRRRRQRGQGDSA